ncbi:MAG: methyltransferase domain-containing protein [Deltaproteobacteria bacterium]|nr:methyltransferase domain-containing protein [Deltaproteobacteria bacterium]
MQYFTGSWATAILSAATTHNVFRAIEGGAWTCDEITNKTGLAPRGAQALLDGLTGLGLLTVKSGKYENTAEASTYLVAGKPTYLGNIVKSAVGSFADWAKYPDAVKTGQPICEFNTDTANHPFWAELVTAIAPLSVPIAQAAAQRLGIAKAGACSWLDVGGGSGVYSAVWLAANPKAQATQLDWSNVNEVAKGFVGGWGVGDRFTTIDGDLTKDDWGTAKYDYVVYSHIAHMYAAATNVSNFKKARQALKAGGTLVINDFVVDNDRAGMPFALLFASNMLIQTNDGTTYRDADYHTWLNEAGFREVNVERTPGPATLIYAR